MKTLFKKTLRSLNKLKNGVTRPAYNATEPFKQCPPQEGELISKEDGTTADRIKGTELFSLFTADIIKENVRFTR